MIVNQGTQPFGLWCWLPGFNNLPEDLAYLFLHLVAVIGCATPKPITHGVVEVADRKGGHGPAIASSTVAADNPSDLHWCSLFRSVGLMPWLSHGRAPPQGRGSRNSLASIKRRWRFLGCPSP